MSKKRIAFVLGHTLFKKGAYSKILGLSEFDFWWQYKEELEELGDVYRHNPLIPSYKVRQRIMAKKTKDYDLVFELHFNMFNGNAKGAEACCYNSFSSIILLYNIYLLLIYIIPGNILPAKYSSIAPPPVEI